MDIFSSISSTELDNLYIPILAQLVVIRKCNLKCAYCNEYDNKSEPVPKIAVLKRVKKLRDMQTKFIEFTGGEPLLHPEISNFVSYSKSIGFNSVAVKTNGTLINMDIIDSFNKSKLDTLQLSLDGMNPNEATIKTIGILKEKLDILSKHANFKVITSATIGSTSQNEIIECISIAKEKGFLTRILLRHDCNGQLNLTQRECKLYEPILEQFSDLLSEAGGYRRKLLLDDKAPFKCRAGCKYLYIDELGIVRWCSQQRQKFGKPLLWFGTKDLKTQFYTKKSCNVKCTLGCARTTSYEYRFYA